MMNYQTLKTELDKTKYTSMSDTAAAASLNAKTLTAKQPIPTTDIKKYLVVTGKMLAIMDSTDDAARIAVVAMSDFEFFHMSDAANAAALTTQLTDLVTAKLLTAADKTAILAMGNTKTSHAAKLELPTVTAGDIQYARSL